MLAAPVREREEVQEQIAGHGMPAFWWFGMVAFWMLVIVGALLFIRWCVSAARRGPAAFIVDGAVVRNHGLEIAWERSARGEINSAEFGASRRVLEE